MQPVSLMFHMLEAVSVHGKQGEFFSTWLQMFRADMLTHLFVEAVCAVQLLDSSTIVHFFMADQTQVVFVTL